MITRSLKLAASAFAALLTLAAGIPAAHGQASISRVNVPFAFEVGSIHLQPGVYVISRVGENMIGVKGTSQSALLMTNREYNAQLPENGKAVFQHIGDKYFLTQVWNAGGTQHLVSVKTGEFKAAQRIELAAQRALPLTTPSPATETTLALLR